MLAFGILYDKKYHKTYSKFIEWWLDQLCCIGWSVDQSRTLGSKDASGGNEDVEIYGWVYQEQYD
uniref:Putative ovule protein n=1 Tax=Solanum chacoense TaxID=4108 RepID=A0A0V0H1B7_SOLCH